MVVLSKVTILQNIHFKFYKKRAYNALLHVQYIIDFNHFSPKTKFNAYICT